MTIELWLLVAAGILTFVQMLVAVQGSTMAVGLAKLSGNREDIGAFDGWTGRAHRAHRNMLENLPLFAILVLTAAAAGISNDLTLWGAHLFFWARLVYSGLYLAGIPWVRTGIWFVSVIGLVLIVIGLL